MHSIIIDAFVTSSHSIQWPFGGNKSPGFAAAAAVRLLLFPVSGRINFGFCSVEMVIYRRTPKGESYSSSHIYAGNVALPQSGIYYCCLCANTIFHWNPFTMIRRCKQIVFGEYGIWGGEQILPLYNNWIFVTKNSCCISPAVSNGRCGIQEWFSLRSSIISSSTGWIWQNYTLPIRRDVHFFEDIRSSIRWL